MNNKKDRNNNNQKKSWKMSKIFRKQTEKINLVWDYYSEYAKAPNRAGTTILMATHAKDIVDNMPKRVIAIDKGTIVRDDRKGMYENEN